MKPCSKSPDPSGLFLYRFEFERIPLDAVAVNAESFSIAIEEFKVLFGESAWTHLQDYLAQIVKVY